MAGTSPLRFSEIALRAQRAAAAAGGPAAAARAAIAEADAFLAEVADKVPAIAARLSGLACAKGCAFCCHQMVGITAAEAALLAQAVATLTEPVRTATQDRIRAVATQSHGMTVAQWWAARLACPLLDESGACVVHAARPLPCRAMNSADAGVCGRAFTGDEESRSIPVLAAPHGIYGHAQAGLAKAGGGGVMPLAAALGAKV